MTAQEDGGISGMRPCVFLRILSFYLFIKYIIKICPSVAEECSTDWPLFVFKWRRAKNNTTWKREQDVTDERELLFVGVFHHGCSSETSTGEKRMHRAAGAGSSGKLQRPGRNTRSWTAAVRCAGEELREDVPERGATSDDNGVILFVLRQSLKSTLGQWEPITVFVWGKDIKCFSFSFSSWGWWCTGMCIGKRVCTHHAF